MNALDATIMVDASTKEFNGNLNGDVAGNVSGVVVGSAGSSIEGDVTGSVFSTGGLTLVNGTTGTLNGAYITDIDTPRIVINRDNDTGISILMSSLTSAGDTASGIEFSVSRGTLETPTAPSAGDPVFLLTGKAYKADITDYALSSAIVAAVGSEPLVGMSNYVSGELQFYATNGTRDLFDTPFAMTFNGAGKLSAPTVEARTAFQLPVYADDAARSSAISTPAKGMMVFMTSGTTPAVTNAAVIYNGSAWAAL